jgi:hypothetical protein
LQFPHPFTGQAEAPNRLDPLSPIVPIRSHHRLAGLLDHLEKLGHVHEALFALSRHYARPILLSQAVQAGKIVSEGAWCCQIQTALAPHCARDALGGSQNPPRRFGRRNKDMQQPLLFALAVAAAGGLRQRIRSRECTVDIGEIYINPRFDELRGHQSAWLASLQTPLNFCKHFRAMNGTHPRR